MHGIMLPTFGLEWHTAMMVYIIVGFTILLFVMSKKLKMVPGKLQSILGDCGRYVYRACRRGHGQGWEEISLYRAISGCLYLYRQRDEYDSGLLAPTENINTAAGLAITVFVFTHAIGIKVHGIKYIKHFLGPVWWMIPIILPIEIIGHFARPMSLTLRLFGNMMGHEQIVGVLMILMPFAYPMLAFSTVLGIVVICVQSFIFSLLAMMYIGGALEEAH